MENKFFLFKFFSITLLISYNVSLNPTNISKTQCPTKYNEHIVTQGEFFSWPYFE